MWWPILQSLGTYLRADAALAGVVVNFGLENPIPDVDTIDLRFGGLPSVDLHSDETGNATLWVDVTHKLAAVDAETAHQTGVAYADLAALTAQVLASIRDWWTETEVPGLDAFKAAVEAVRSDGDELRDYQVIAARIVLNIEWRKTEA